MANFASRLGDPTAECFQLPDQGLCPWTPLGLCPQTSVIGSRSALDMSPTRAFCPPHCFRPGDAPPYTAAYNMFKQTYTIEGVKWRAVGWMFPSPAYQRSGSVVSSLSGVPGRALPKTISVLSRRDRTPLIVMSVIHFHKPVQ